MDGYDWSPEDCDACYAAKDVCPYHRGVADGIEWMARHLRNIADDPERLNALAFRTGR